MTTLAPTAKVTIVTQAEYAACLAKQKPRIEKAEVALVLDDVFFGTMLAQTPIFDCGYDGIPTCQTFQTNGVSIRYNPFFADELSDEEVRGVLVHELYHIILLHSWRRQHRDPLGFNIACDHAINLNILEWIQSLRGRGLVSCYDLPQNRLADPIYKNLCEEEIYNKLPKNYGGKGGKGKQPPGGYPGRNWGEVVDAPGNPQDQAESLQAAKENITQARAVAKLAGKLPAGLERVLDGILTPKVDWKEKLRTFITTTVRDDYRWSRPRPIWLAEDVILPSLWGEGCGHVVVGNDTSGSIDDTILRKFFAEIKAIFEDVKPSRLSVLHCDADVAGIDEFTQGDDLKIHPKGGGGTDFRPLFNHIEEKGWDPVCVVYLTDGQGAHMDNPPPYPVLWVLTENSPTPWGERVEIYD